MGRNILRLDVKGIEETINQLNRVAKEDSKKATEDALTKAGKKVGDDTVRSLDKAYLPAGGKYSRGASPTTMARSPAPSPANAPWKAAASARFTLSRCAPSSWLTACMYSPMTAP